MKLEQQVCSLELAQKLKSLGVKQESQCWYSDGGFGTAHTVLHWGPPSTTQTGHPTHDFAAFTVAELGEMLPYYICAEKEYEVEQVKYGEFMWFRSGMTSGEHNQKRWMIEYETRDGRSIEGFVADTEADARAKMLIYLIENKLISL